LSVCQSVDFTETSQLHLGPEAVRSIDVISTTVSISPCSTPLPTKHLSPFCGPSTLRPTAKHLPFISSTYPSRLPTATGGRWWEAKLGGGLLDPQASSPSGLGSLGCSSFGGTKFHPKPRPTSCPALQEMGSSGCHCWAR
jgi:hypothetical protein